MNRSTVVAIIISVIVLVGLTYWASVRDIEPLTNVTPTSSPQVRPPQPPVSPALSISGWRLYKNEEYGFEFEYPDYFESLKPSQYFKPFNSALALRAERLNTGDEYVGGLSVVVYPFSEFRSYGGGGYWIYEPAEQKWFWELPPNADGTTLREERLPDELTVAGRKGYLIGVGDAGAVAVRMIIPYNNILIVISSEFSITGYGENINWENLNPQKELEEISKRFNLL